MFKITKTGFKGKDKLAPKPLADRNAGKEQSHS
jgi:hypothetical protein